MFSGKKLLDNPVKPCDNSVMEEPFIARDTKEPLVILGGYRINKNGGIISQALPDEVTLPEPTPEDFRLLKEHGRDGLQEMGYFAVLDRLNRCSV